MTIVRVKRVPFHYREGRDMTLTRWDPFRDLLGLQHDFARLFGHEGSTAWAPPIDIYERPDSYHVVAELPGFGPDDVDVTVDDGTLTIKGERKFYDEVNEDSFRRVERRFGAFQRSISLPAAVDAGTIDASFDKGVLTVDIPKAETAKPRRVEIKAKA